VGHVLAFLAQISQSISKLPFADSTHSIGVAHSPQISDHSNNRVNDAILIVRDAVLEFQKNVDGGI
jgi:hypothetical protein